MAMGDGVRRVCDILEAQKDLVEIEEEFSVGDFAFGRWELM